MKVLSYSIVTLLAVPNVMAFSPAMKPKAFLGSKVGEGKE